MVSCLDKAFGGSLPAISAHSFASNGQLTLFKSAEEGKSFPLNSRIDRGSAACEADRLPTKLPHLVFATYEKDPEFLTCLLYPDKALLCNESGPRLCLNHPCMSCLSFEALGQHFHSKLKI